MASLAAALNVRSSATKESMISSSSSLRRSDGLREICRVALPGPGRSPKKGLLSVKAMGVVKFKGTQMREKHLTEMIEKKVVEAKEVCEGNQSSDECKVAWDEVEEVSQAKADLRRRMEKQDPLESFCQENPETDECRIYED